MTRHKALQKVMTPYEVEEYLSSHHKYRLLTLEELQGCNDIYYSFIHGNTITDGFVEMYNSLDISNPLQTCNQHVKFKVYLTYSDEYIRTLEECKSHVEKADPMVIGNILLKELLKYT